MEVCKLLKNAQTFQQYMEISHDAASKPDMLRNVQLNMSTIIAVKNVRSLEIEYFNKCDDSGVSFKILEKIFALPASKSWHVLGKEVISLVQYWLDAVRKHLITHNINWWSFLKQLLGFIKQITKKSSSLSNLLIEETAESLLDLATNGKLDVIQRHGVLHTFNLYSAESSREIRLAYKGQLEHYFIRLATIMSSCGHLPTQYSILETLLRWLVPRNDQALRRDSANKWFPPHLYRQGCVALFLERPWMNFFQDARDFLNSHNVNNDVITSIICRKISVGSMQIVSGTERRQIWLDINLASRCLSVLLDPLLLDVAGCPEHVSCEALVVSADNALEIKLHRDSTEIAISAITSGPPQVLPSQLTPFAALRTVRFVVSSRGDLLRVDNALRAVFQEKYQVLLDFENLTCLSPLSATAKRRSSREEDTRFSMPAKEMRRKQSGYVVQSRRPVSWKSPSTTSTTSLAHLHDRLEALPNYRFDYQPVSICASPKLSDVTELTESTRTNSTCSTLKLRPGGYCHRKRNNMNETRTSQSDSEVRNLDTIQEEANTKNARGFQSDAEDKKAKDKHNSSLFAATIGTADESVINATLERLPRNKELNTDNLMELLVQEAMNTKETVSDSGINTDDAKKSQEEDYSEAIENTPFAEISKGSSYVKKKQYVVSKSTSDESNTEAINETPMAYVNVRKRNSNQRTAKPNQEEKELITCDVEAVENFFSQHFVENRAGDLIISPTLAKKINETSSETSEDFDDCLITNMNVEKLPNMDVIECLNNMIDKVCNEFEKCTEYLERDVNSEALVLDYKIETKKDLPLHDIGNLGPGKKINTRRRKTPEPSNDNSENQKTTPKGRGKKIKLKFPFKNQKAKKKATKTKLPLEPVSKMSTILEVNTETDVSLVKNTSLDKSTATDIQNNTSSMIRRKRKLYSPKDDAVASETNAIDREEKASDSTHSDEDIILADLKKDESVTPKPIATCYKELEKERQKHKRLRTRRSRCKNELESPKTKKMNDVFDHLKDTVESNEKIMLADKTSIKDVTVFNFTSDSEDEDFKQKKMELQKRASTTTVASGNSILSTRRGRKVNYTENDKESSTETGKKTNVRQKKMTKRNTRTRKTVKNIDLVDERMRAAAPEKLNTSFVANENSKESENLAPVIKTPELEILEDNIDNPQIIEERDVKVNITRTRSKSKANKQAKRSEKILAVKKEINDNINNAKQQNQATDDDRTESPLPGLLVERVIENPTLDDSLTTNMLQKFKRIYQEGADNETNITNTTQNMLSDFEQVGPQINVTDEVDRIEKEFSKVNDNETSEKEQMNIIEVVPDNEVNINDIEGFPSNDFEDTPRVDDSFSSKKKRSLRLKSRIPSIIDNSIPEIVVEKSKLRNKTKLYNSDDVSQGNSVTSQKHKVKKSQEKRIDPISIDSNITQSNKTQPSDIIAINTKVISRVKSIEKSQETINISDVTEVKSERSIATVGITAHGDFDEVPPGYDTLKENVTPRETVDMDASTKQYYMKMRQMIDLSTESKTKKETHSPKTSTPQFSKEERENEIKKWLRSRKDSSSSERSVSVSIKRMSVAEISKWLPSKRDSASDRDSVPNLSNDDLRKWLPSPRSSDSDATKKSSVKLPKPRPLKRIVREKTPSQEVKRKSVISPIRFCDDTPSSIKNNDTKDTKNTSNDTQTTQKTKDSVHKLNASDKKYYTRSITRDVTMESSTSNITVPKSPNKRCGAAVTNTDCKKKKIEAKKDAVVSSGPSVSSVDDWFKNRTPSTKEEQNICDSVKDVVENVIEKLETTLAEVHRNTSSDFIHMFVDAQKQLTELKIERNEMYRTTATNILTRVSRVLEEEFTELDRRSAAIDTTFMGWLKQRAVETIKEDCRKKRAMVALLREDAEAVLNHISRLKRKNK